MANTSHHTQRYLLHILWFSFQPVTSCTEADNCGVCYLCKMCHCIQCVQRSCSAGVSQSSDVFVSNFKRWITRGHVNAEILPFTDQQIMFYPPPTQSSPFLNLSPGGTTHLVLRFPLVTVVVFLVPNRGIIWAWLAFLSWGLDSSLSSVWSMSAKKNRTIYFLHDVTFFLHGYCIV